MFTLLFRNLIDELVINIKVKLKCKKMKHVEDSSLSKILFIFLPIQFHRCSTAKYIFFVVYFVHLSSII